MSFVHLVLRGLFDLALMPFRALSPWVSLVPISLLTAILALLVYRRFSNQPALERVKNQIAASFFEIRLFNDDLRAILRAQWDLLRNNGVYLALNLRPMVWMLVPMLVLLTQLQFHYGYQGLAIGAPTVVTIDLAESAVTAGARPAVELRCPDGIRLERGGIWIPAKRRMAWRVAGEQPGRYELVIEIDGATFTKTVVVSDEVVRRSPQRLRASFLNQILYPAEEPLDADSPVVAIRVPYPAASLPLFGFDINWIVAWLVLTMVLAYALRKRMGVTF